MRKNFYLFCAFVLCASCHQKQEKQIEAIPEQPATYQETTILDGVYRFHFQGFELWTLQDSQKKMSAKLFPDAKKADIEQYMPDGDAESAINRIERDQNAKKLLLITCGYSDTLYPCSRAFCERCKELGVPYIEVYSPGVHSWTYWDYALRLHLWYFSRILNGENLGY